MVIGVVIEEDTWTCFHWACLVNKLENCEDIMCHSKWLRPTDYCEFRNRRKPCRTRLLKKNLDSTICNENVEE